jgi:hypothetical protein
MTMKTYTTKDGECIHYITDCPFGIQGMCPKSIECDNCKGDKNETS